MCQPKDKGGRRCPTHQPASIGLKKFMVEEYGLLPSQVEHTFKTLRNQARNYPNPTQEEYQHLINRSKTKLSRANRITDKGRNSVERQLGKNLTDSELPDGATFYALKQLHARSREQKRAFVQMIREIAEHRGTNRNEALQAFKTAYDNSEDAIEHDMGEGFDSRTLAIYRNMISNEGTSTSGMPEFSEEPRITRSPLPHGSTWITSVGYDPDDGRLEVETNGNVYAYHGVPQAVWNEIQTRQDAPSYISRNILRNREYAYESEAARTRDAVGRYCEDCHKYRAISGHVCDAPGAARERAQEEENLAIIETAMAEEENLSVEQKASYEEALERIRKNLESPEEPEPEAPVEEEPAAEETPAPRRRVRRGPTARQRRWMVPVEERETVDLNASEHVFLPNGRVRVPKIAEIKRAVMTQGGVATFDLKSPTQYTRREEGGYDYYNTTTSVKVYADGENGDLKFERGDLQCTCDAYARNYTCEHVTGRTSFSSVMDELHRRISPQSYLRANAGDEPPLYTRASSRAANAYGTSYTLEDAADDVNTYTVTTSENFSQTEWREIRNSVENGQPVRVRLSMFANPTTRYYGYGHNGTFTSTISVDEDGNFVFSNTNVACYRCGRNEMTCGHTQNFEAFVRDGLQGNLNRGHMPYNYGRNSSSSRPVAVDYSSLDTAARLTALNETLSSEWMADPDAVQEMESTFGGDESGGYSKNIDGYIADVRAAQERIDSGEEAIPFTTEPVTNGVCSPESGRGFGIEIEYVLPRGQRAREVGNAIAQELKEAGLSDISNMTYYHGYSGNQWHIEQDCTVDGEVVSPILHDTPEHWEQVKKVCDIIKRHGGKASASTGGHVHMGLGRGSSAEVARRKASVTQIYTAYEDSIRRVQTDPKRKTHRDSQWCRPLDAESAQRGIYNARENRRMYEDHNTSLNLGHAGRVEFRGADGSLDPGHIQAQVMMSAGIVAAAERGETPGEGIRHSKIGSNAKKIKAIRGENSVTTAKTDDELIVTDAEFRKFTDLVMPGAHGRKATAGIAANTPWQESRYVSA